MISKQVLKLPVNTPTCSCAMMPPFHILLVKTLTSLATALSSRTFNVMGWWKASYKLQVCVVQSTIPPGESCFMFFKCKWPNPFTLKLGFSSKAVIHVVPLLSWYNSNSLVNLTEAFIVPAFSLSGPWSVILLISISKVVLHGPLEYKGGTSFLSYTSYVIGGTEAAICHGFTVKVWMLGCVSFRVSSSIFATGFVPHRCPLGCGLGGLRRVSASPAACFGFLCKCGMAREEEKEMVASPSWLLPLSAGPGRVGATSILSPNHWLLFWAGGRGHLRASQSIENWGTWFSLHCEE